MTNRGGYDAAESLKGDDRLDRWQFASRIAEVAKRTPPDWAVRIGVFGKWGEGKTTVLRYLEKFFLDNNDIVFWFTPWASQSWDGLWEEFGTNFFAALSDAEIPYDGAWRAAAKTRTAWLTQSGACDAADAAAGLVGAGGIPSSAFSIFSQWLKYDSTQIEIVRQKLGDRRVVVLIDDLDRCSPEFLPQLLLSLREILDLPSFTFILAFDDEIVSEGLVTRNPAWSDGSAFLEKILDFTFHIPPMTTKHRRELALSNFGEHCSFIPVTAIEPIEDLLPGNPRKLKAMVRSLVAVQGVVERHGEDELNLTDLVLAQMIKLESHEFFARFVEQSTFGEYAGVLFHILKSESNKKSTPSLDDLLTLAGVNGKSSRSRLVQLVEAVRARGSLSFRDSAVALTDSKRVTRKEFLTLFDDWRKAQGREVFLGWIDDHTQKRFVRREDTIDAVFQRLIETRESFLGMASEATLTQQHVAIVGDAQQLLVMLQSFFCLECAFNADRFDEFYKQVQRWARFRTNSADLEAREQEYKVVLKLVEEKVSSHALQLFDLFILRMPEPASFVDRQEIADIKLQLHGSCVAILAPIVTAETIEFLSKEGAGRALREGGRYRGYKHCLFHPKSPIRAGESRETFVRLIERGRRDMAVCSNIEHLLFMLADGVKMGLEDVSAQEVVETVTKDQDIVRVLWEVSTAKSIQYRSQHSFIEKRQLLIDAGIEERCVPLTDELQARMRSGQ